MAPDETDDLSFENYGVRESQPDQLATVATLRGLRPPDIERSRVLELHCGSGQNLLPLAERYPHSTFVGISSSARQIALARETAAAVGIGNAEFRQQSLLEAPIEPGSFDYIIAHGVYSTVEEPARDRLLAICGQALSPQGVAYVSYNVYPGWHVRDMFRAMMRYEARGETEPAAQMAKGRTLLEFLKGSLTSPDAPYDAMIGAELEPLMREPDAVLRRELLGEVSYPVYVRRFLEHAGSHGLQYLGDGTQGVRYADALPAKIEQDLQAVTSNPIEQMQYRDILVKKTYRQTLLCRVGVNVQPMPTAQAVEGLYFDAPIRREHPQLPLNSSQTERLFGPGDSSLQTAAPLAKAALVHLGEVWPQNVRFDQLVGTARARLEQAGSPAPGISPADVIGLAQSLIQCCEAGIVEVQVKPHSFTAAVSVRPTASRLTQWQAARSPAVTNRRHVGITVDPFDLQVLRLLDGTRDQSQILSQLVDWAMSGQIQLRSQQGVMQDPNHIRQMLEVALPQLLARLAQNAFLVG